MPMSPSATQAILPFEAPVGPSPDGRYFTDAHGAPAFWLGDTQWELFRLFTAAEAKGILENRRAKGFSAILVMLTGVKVSVFTDRPGAPYENLEGEVPWLNDDPLQPNERYFAHIDELIGLGATTGQTLVVGVYHQWEVDTITVANARAWANWVGARYRSVPNLMWSMYPQALPEYVPVCREIAAGLSEGDGGTHLISCHPDPSVASSSFMHDDTWLAFNMIQTCMDFDRIVEAVNADYCRHPVKPVVMAEGAYEGLEFGRFQTPHDVRKQAYWTQLAGGHHVYGHNDAWMTPREWPGWIDAPGSLCLAVFRQMVSALPQWWRLVPDQSLLAEGEGSGFARNVAARSAAADWIVAYISEPDGAVALRLDCLSPQPGSPRRARARLLNPASGEARPAGDFETSELPRFAVPEGWEDAVVVVSI